MIDNPDLLSFLQTEAARAVDGDLDEQRKVLIDFYHARPFGDEVEGRSQVVTRDVAEVVDYMTVSVLRTFFSGDRVVEFEAKDPNLIQAADDATEVISYQFLRGQDGYRISHDFLKAGLLEKSGVVKTWPEVKTQRQIAEVGNHELEDGENGPSYQGNPITAHEPGQGPTLDGLTGEMLHPGTSRIAYDVEMPALFHDAAVPNEEFLVSADARDLETAAYICHQTAKSLADLYSMGFDFDQAAVWNDNPDSRIVSNARDEGRSRKDSDDPTRRGLLRRVWLREEYVFFDANGDGVVERLCVHRVGTTILAITEVDDQPFVLWTPFPIAHRLIGESLADKITDIQRVRSVLRRQALDNLYLSNSPRTLVNETGMSENTIEDLLTVAPGAPIRYTGATPPTPLVIPFTAAHAFDADERLIGDRESRSGITRLNQGLDADALNKTASGTALMQAQGQQMEDYIARNFAEGMLRLFIKKYHQLRQHSQPITIQVGGQFRSVDPRTWPADMDVRIRVGLGSGRKDQRVQLRQMILQIQQMGMEAQAPVVDWQGIYNNLKGLIADTQLGNVSDFFQDPSQAPPQQPQPDPDTQKLQAQMQLDQAKFQADQQNHQAKLAMDQSNAEAKLATEQQRHAADIQLQREKSQAEIEMNMQRMAGESQLQQQQIAANERAQMYQAELEHQRKTKQMDLDHEHKLAVLKQRSHLSENRPGGSLAE